MSATSLSEPEDERLSPLERWTQLLGGGMDFRPADRADCDLHDVAPGAIWVRLQSVHARHQCSDSSCSVGRTDVRNHRWRGSTFRLEPSSCSPQSHPPRSCCACLARAVEPTARPQGGWGVVFVGLIVALASGALWGRYQRRPCRRGANPAAHRHARNLRHGAGLRANPHERHRHPGRSGDSGRPDWVRNPRRHSGPRRDCGCRRSRRSHRPSSHALRRSRLRRRL